MGFDLEQFFKELEYKVSHAEAHILLLEYIKSMKEYAKVCGKL